MEEVTGEEAALGKMTQRELQQRALPFAHDGAPAHRVAPPAEVLMIGYFFFPAADGTSDAEVADHARRYLAAHPSGQDAAGAALHALPDHLDLEALVQQMPASRRESARRYLTRQVTTHGPRGQEMMPGLAGDDTAAISYVALSVPWRGYGAGTIAGIRRTKPVGLLAVFEGWSIDAVGRLSFSERPPIFRAPRAPAPPTAGAALLLAGAAQTDRQVADFLLDLTSYVGLGLSAAGLPVVGLLVRFLSSQTQKAVDSAFGQGQDLLSGFKKLLDAHKISLETDLAAAQVKTYQDYMHIHYNDAWLEDVQHASDPMPAEAKEHLEKLRTFVKKVTDDFDGTSELFTAVNLMRVQAPSASPDLHAASEAMYKASGFFYMANLALTLGRQAFNAQYAMEGAAAAQKIAALVADYSTEYTAYAVALKAAVDEQVRLRVGKLYIPEEMPGDVTIWDFYDPPGTMRYRRACCGGPDCRKKRRGAEAHLKRLQADIEVAYRQHLCDMFWGKKAESLDAAVAAMKDNDEKLKALAAQCRKARA